MTCAGCACTGSSVAWNTSTATRSPTTAAASGVIYTELSEWILPGLFAVDQPNSPPQLRHALELIDGCVADHLAAAGLAAGAA